MSHQWRFCSFIFGRLNSNQSSGWSLQWKLTPFLSQKYIYEIRKISTSFMILLHYYLWNKRSLSINFNRKSLFASDFLDIAWHFSFLNSSIKCWSTIRLWNNAKIVFMNQIVLRPNDRGHVHMCAHCSSPSSFQMMTVIVWLTKLHKFMHLPLRAQQQQKQFL